MSKLKSRPVFIGPSASAIRTLGDKIASTIVAQTARVPCLPWSGNNILLAHDVENEEPIQVSKLIYSLACIKCCRDGLAIAHYIGYPVMIKASQGGGGKGIRLAHDRADFSESFHQVEKEVPGSPIFIMKVADNVRHLEVQILADQYGNVITLFGRDCSVQRRHQKIIEEAPVVIAPASIRESMEASAVRIAKLVGYSNAGTVEYLYSAETQEYYFLELNPRLQVEHPTTEMISGINIPAAQLQIAMGIPLDRIRDIRLMYGLAPHGISKIDFHFHQEDSQHIQRRPFPKGHVIAARITAEDPSIGFKPNSGTVSELNFRSNNNVWGYFSVSSSGAVHEYSDSQFGHIFAYGETREIARKHLVIALKGLSIRGDFRTTNEYLVKLLETNDFIQNTFTTHWLDGLIAKKETEQTDLIPVIICGGVWKTYQVQKRNRLDFENAFQRGQVPNRQLVRTSFNFEFVVDKHHIKLVTLICGPESIKILVNDSANEVRFKNLPDDGLLVLFGGSSFTIYGNDTEFGTTLIINDKTYVLEKETDPSVLKSPSPGKLVRYLVNDGDLIRSGQTYAELEVMKMCLPLVSHESGKIKLIKAPGVVLSSGDTIASLHFEGCPPLGVFPIFRGKLPDLG